MYHLINLVNFIPRRIKMLNICTQLMLLSSQENGIIWYIKHLITTGENQTYRRTTGLIKKISTHHWTTIQWTVIPSPVKPTDSVYFTMNRQSETKAILSINPDLFIQALSVMIDYVKLQRERQCVKTGNPLIHPITLCWFKTSWAGK